MSEQSGGRFEKLQHFVFGGEIRIVPLLVRFNGEPVDTETAGLLQATNILGGNFEDDFVNKLDAFKEEYLKVRSGEKPPFMVADDQGAGAVAISKEIVNVSSVDQKWSIDPDLFGDFLNAWADYNSHEESEPAVRWLNIADFPQKKTSE